MRQNGAVWLLVAGGAAAVEGDRGYVAHGDVCAVWAGQIESQTAQSVPDLTAAPASRDVRVNPRVLSAESGSV